MKKLILIFVLAVIYHFSYAQFLGVEKNIVNTRLNSFDNQILKQDLNFRFSYTDSTFVDTFMVKNVMVNIALGFCKSRRNPIDIPEFSMLFGYKIKPFKSVLLIPYVGAGISFNLLNKSITENNHPYFDFQTIKGDEYNFEEGYFIDYKKTETIAPDFYITPEIGAYVIVPIYKYLNLTYRSYLSWVFFDKYEEKYKFTADLGDLRLRYYAPVTFVSTVGLALNILYKD
jgi:hypothetical protein